MKHSLIKLVDVILRRIQERPEAMPSEKGLRSWLTRQGYNKRDIDDAIKMVRPQLLPHSQAELGHEAGETGFPPMTVRLLSVYEEYKLTPEARNALARLEVYGLLNAYERESILDYLNHCEGEVGLDELDYMLSWMVCSNRDVEFQQTFYNVFEGKGEVLH